MTSIFNSHLKVRRFILSTRLVRLSFGLLQLVATLRGSRDSRQLAMHPLLSVLCMLRLSSVHMLTRALLGLWIFHRLLGGGGAFERPPHDRSAPGRRREKRKAAFESSRKIISKSFLSFFLRSKLRSPRVKISKFSKRFFDNKIFNFKGRATNLIPSCLSR